MKEHNKPYHTEVNDLEIIVFPDVYSPAYFTDSAWFAKVVPEIVGEKWLLEIGTGTGIVALFAALNGATVVATDINPHAVANAKENFRLYGLDIPVLQGDIYEPLHPEEKFEFIFWNHPFNRAKEPVDDVLLQAGFDYHYQGLEAYIANARTFLRPNGKLLLGTGNFANFPEINRLCRKHTYTPKIIRRETTPLTPRKQMINEYFVLEL